MEADECSFSVLNGVTHSYCSGSFLCVLVVGTDIHPNLACLYTAHDSVMTPFARSIPMGLLTNDLVGAFCKYGGCYCTAWVLPTTNFEHFYWLSGNSEERGWLLL